MGDHPQEIDRNDSDQTSTDKGNTYLTLVEKSKNNRKHQKITQIFLKLNKPKTFVELKREHS